MPKILAVDDSNVILNLIADFFSDEHKVITASNGREAVDTAIRDMPDLIIMDVKMPVMDGLQATRILKEDPRTMSIPIIILTAKGQMKDLFELSSNIFAFVEKPFEPKNLVKIVKDAIASKPSTTP
ncbi:MAG: hypothetical protein A2X34_10810 [Elusimicrobia bacterium GWC2_51_8]|nr:MAG: hypothetical protein A2X34_10810 [Elusimicrobia bacterium GWC2_51_8]